MLEWKTRPETGTLRLITKFGFCFIQFWKTWAISLPNTLSGGWDKNNQSRTSFIPRWEAYILLPCGNLLESKSSGRTFLSREDLHMEMRAVTRWNFGEAAIKCTITAVLYTSPSGHSYRRSCTCNLLRQHDINICKQFHMKVILTQEEFGPSFLRKNSFQTFSSRELPYRNNCSELVIFFARHHRLYHNCDTLHEPYWQFVQPTLYFARNNVQMSSTTVSCTMRKPSWGKKVGLNLLQETVGTKILQKTGPAFSNREDFSWNCLWWTSNLF